MGKLRAAEHTCLRHNIAWEELAHTAGYGSVHLSTQTVRLLRRVCEERHSARRINNRFGEGASSRLRQLREGLDALGLGSDSILNHATPRIFYGCKLVPNADRQLMGIADVKETQGTGLGRIAVAWRSRWLHRRIQRSDILARLAATGPETVLSELGIHSTQLELNLTTSTAEHRNESPPRGTDGTEDQDACVENVRGEKNAALK